MKLTCFFLIFVFSNSQAKTLLVRSGEVSPEVYESHLHTYPHLQSPVQLYIAQSQTQKINKQMEKLFVLAKKNFLQSELTTATEHYKSVVQLSYENDWSETLSSLISHSYFRLAQLEKEQSENWLKQALAFAPDTAPNPHIFPPPLVQKWRVLKKQVQFLPWTPDWDFHLYQWVLINGRKQPIIPGTPLLLAKTQNRVVLLSDFLQPQIKVGAGEDIMSWKPNFTPLVTGSCENPQFVSEQWFDQTKKLALFKDSCVGPKSLNLLPEKTREAELPSSMTPAFSANTTASKTSELKKSWIKNKWLWISLATVGTYLIYDQHLRPSEREVIPSHQTGF